ncbi:hypothetical protein U0C82_18520 [Fulvimarina sp. 2208YS6-2-32]|uniref:Secreted protein n=1 Tax=Fulvimarina uroteuthidis TaxID=3098149 RepID=A0ABU5I6V8_9HYPH|nr:hypothetical protein [Fulvimarina sp. 2208YS6-2-32]MDY8111119.1 hypothetical protein [Fulvimarina sp. 2208YS6-2-32]
MKLAPIGVAGEALSRRAFLASTSTALVVSTVPAMAWTADAISTEAGDRLERVMFFEAEIARFNEERAGAVSTLPAWAKPGLDTMDSDGERVGRLSYWPEIKDATPPDGRGVYRTIRYPLRNIFKRALLLESHLPVGHSHRVQAKVRAHEIARQWIARRREQEAEHRKAGIYRIDEQINDLFDRMNEDETWFVHHGDRTGNLDIIGARLFLGLRSTRSLEEPEPYELDGMAVAVLRSIAGRLTGKTRDIITKALADAQEE